MKNELVDCCEFVRRCRVKFDQHVALNVVAKFGRMWDRDFADPLQVHSIDMITDRRGNIDPELIVGAFIGLGPQEVG